MIFPSNNQILGALRPEHYLLLSSHLERVPLRRSQLIERAGERITSVYFPESAVLSLTTSMGGKSLDAALIGFEGMCGISLAFGNELAVYTKIVRVPGTALKLPRSVYLSALEKAPELRLHFLRYAESLRYQVAMCTAAAAHMQLEARLARAILMLQDRSEGGVIRITHQTLAAILGATRPPVTSACAGFNDRSLVRCARRRVEVLDRSGLIALSKGSYGEAEAHHVRLHQEPRRAA